jgi:hypothetical protein
MSCNEDKDTNKRPWRAADGAGPQSAQSYLAEDLSSNLNLLRLEFDGEGERLCSTELLLPATYKNRRRKLD